MHDKNGTPLQKGDTVLIPAVITDLHETEDYCNVGVETVHGRRPDGAKERFSAINTAVMVKFAALAMVAFLALAGTANAAERKTVPWPFSDSWTKNILVATLIGCPAGALVGSRTGWIGGAHGIATGTAIGCVSGVIVGATFPHSRF